MTNLPEPIPSDATLEQLEAIIAAELGGFLRVGMALSAIRDRKLYKAGHSNFDLYCRERWGFGDNTAYRRIVQAKVAQGLPPGAPIPSQRAATQKPPRSAPTPPLSSDNGAKARGSFVEPDAPAVSPSVQPATDRYDQAVDTMPKLRAREASEVARRLHVRLGTAGAVEEARAFQRWAAEVEREVHGVRSLRSEVQHRSVISSVKPGDCKHPMTRRLGDTCVMCGATLGKAKK